MIIVGDMRIGPEFYIAGVSLLLVYYKFRG
jgi:hypothetical protein